MGLQKESYDRWTDDNVSGLILPSLRGTLDPGGNTDNHWLKEPFSSW
uniref:Uncharacterized protein n=1 Tax=Anguilla anguilla TaxID=7936 RepID=A0A0E9T9E5_ANGAN